MNRITCCELDEFLEAMSDETRERILVLLRDCEMSVNELTEHFALTQPTISHHLGILPCASRQRAARRTADFLSRQSRLCRGVLPRNSDAISSARRHRARQTMGEENQKHCDERRAR